MKGECLKRGVVIGSLQVSLNVTRAVKNQMVSMDGGWTSENVAVLIQQSKDVASRLTMLMKVVRAATPMK